MVLIFSFRSLSLYRFGSALPDHTISTTLRDVEVWSAPKRMPGKPLFVLYINKFILNFELDIELGRVVWQYCMLVWGSELRCSLQKASVYKGNTADSYEREQERLKKLFQKFLPDEEEDPFESQATSDEYGPSKEQHSNESSEKDAPVSQKCKRQKGKQVTYGTYIHHNNNIRSINQNII